MNTTELNQFIHEKLGRAGEPLNYAGDRMLIWDITETYISKEGFKCEVKTDKVTGADLGTEYTLMVNKKPYTAFAPTLEEAMARAIATVFVLAPNFKLLEKEEAQLALF
jgi:hypothetical protein